MRAESARRVYSPRRGYGYPNVPALSRARSQDRVGGGGGGRAKASGSEDDQETGGGRVRIRNIEIPEHHFGDVSSSPAGAGRPSTAPAGGRRRTRRSRGRSSGRRSPSHPNYKDDVYLKSKVTLRYVGHPEKDQSLEVSSGLDLSLRNSTATAIQSVARFES